jgi:hypothetical protein
MKTSILVVLLLTWWAHESPGAAALTADEFEVYFETLRVMRTGVIDTVWVGDRLMLVRESAIATSYKHVSTDKIPSAYRSAFSDLAMRVGQEYRADLSPLATEGVALADSLYFEPGVCTIAFSAVGFGKDKQTAVLLITSGCKDVPHAFEGELLLCLIRSPYGWQATDYALVKPSAMKEIARLFAADNTQDVNIYKGFAEDVFVLGSKSRLIVEAPDGLKEYEAGDRIRLRWEDGILYINDLQIRPPIELPRELRTVETIKRRYGGCPVVIRYVEEHQRRGAEIEIWNQALELWEQRVAAVFDYAVERYPTLLVGDVDQGLSPLDPGRAAAAVARDIEQQTDLVQSAVIDSVVHTVEHSEVVKEMALSIRFRGQDHADRMLLPTTVPGPRPEPGPRLVPKSEFDSWHTTLERMERQGRKRTVEIRRGGVSMY